jgi:hypothetical protein
VATNDAGEKLSKQTLAPALRPEDTREDMRKALRFLGYAVPDGDMTARAMLDYAATRT